MVFIRFWKWCLSLSDEKDYYIKVKGKWYKVSLDQYILHNPDPGLFLNDNDRLNWLKDQGKQK